MSADRSPSLVVVKQEFEKLLSDTTLVTLALAIGFGWSLYELAHGVADTIDGLLTHIPSGQSGFPGVVGSGLTWYIGDRVLTLDEAFVGLVELAAVAAVAVLIRRRTNSA